MKMKPKVWAILIGFVVGSIAYFFNVNNETIWGFPSAFFSWGLMAVGAFSGSFLLTIFLLEPPSIIALFVYLGVLFGVIARIGYDLFNDPGTHNLFPLEIIFISFITIPSAFAGAFLAPLKKTE